MKTILIVDDEKNVRLFYQEEFKDEGYNVVTAANGLEALKILAEGKPVDLVLLDIKMPEMDGPEFLRQVRQSYKTLPIIISTAYGDLLQQDFSVWLSDGYTIKSDDSLKTADLSKLKVRVKELLGE